MQKGELAVYIVGPLQLLCGTIRSFFFSTSCIPLILLISSPYLIARNYFRLTRPPYVSPSTISPCGLSFLNIYIADSDLVNNCSLLFHRISGGLSHILNKPYLPYPSTAATSAVRRALDCISTSLTRIPRCTTRPCPSPCSCSTAAPTVDARDDRPLLLPSPPPSLQSFFTSYPVYFRTR